MDSISKKKKSYFKYTQQHHVKVHSNALYVSIRQNHTQQL